MAVAIVASGLFSNKALAQGTVPVSVPTGGFRIEGDLQANIPVAGVGDWIPGGAGSGGNVLTAAGVPLNPATTFHIIDPYNGGDDIFQAGKFNENPNTTWNWVTGGANNKTDVNNVLMHFATNPANNHAWFVFSGDRLANNGVSYQDFEFLQGTLTKNAGGSFTSSGPHGGRTINDFLFTVEFGSGSSTFVFYKWAQISPGVYDYVQFTPPAGTALGFTNSASIAVPYGAFGLTTYGLVETFVEGAVDLDAVVGAIVTSCSGINVHTFMSKTKVSTAQQASLSDLITPLALNLTIGFAGTTSTTSTTCSGACNGTAIATITGGTSPYAYSWNTSPVQTGQTATGLCAGNYTVTVTDQRPCSITLAVTITGPAPVTNTITPTAVTCFGVCNGRAIANPVGGTGAYTYAWNTSPAQNGRTATNLCAGNYTVTVTDVNGCTTVTGVSITQPPQLNVTTSNTSVFCNGGSNGTATANASGGTGTYTYFWNPSSQTTNPATNLTAGNYTVTVTDQNGCTRTATTTVTQPPVLTTTSNHTNVNCFGGNNASAWAIPSGGTPGYFYSWSTAPSQSGQTATGLTAGNYTVVVSDQRGCNTTTIVTITQPPQVTAVINSHTNVLCFGQCNGTAIATPGGGVGGYTYVWNPTAQTGQTASNLCAGLYVVTVTDANGCSTTTGTPVNITQPAQLTPSVSSVDSVDCNGGSDGQISVSVTGGTPNYSYAWTPNVSSTNTASNLPAQCYTVNITDANGCTATTTACVQQPAVLVSTVTSQSDVLCNGGNTGSAGVGATGGSPQYTYTWDPPVSTASSASNLIAGNYTVTVTDQNGCSTTTPITITQPPALTATWDSTSSTCGQNDGSTWVNPTGGVGGYTYVWNTSPAQSGQTATSVQAGNYQVIITDANGCTLTVNTSVSDETSPVTSATVVTDVGCFGDTTGVAYVTVTSGGTPPFTYSWSPGGATTATVTVSMGNYVVTVTDANGCIASNQINITEPPQLTSTISSSTNVSCNGVGDGVAIVTPGGGVGPYTYNWSPTSQTTATASNLSPGSYSVTVTDSHGCTTVSTVTITQPPTLLATAVVVDSVGCHGEATGSIFTTPAGGTLPYTYTWLDCLGNGTGLPDSASQVGNLSAGCYCLTVTDANGCTFDTCLTVLEPDTIVPLIDAIQLNGFEIKCFGDSNGIAYVDTVFGGTGPYIYVWSNNLGGNDTIYNLFPGQYSITVFDANGCSADTTITLTQPQPITAQLSSDNISCTGSCDGWIDIVGVFGGIPGYTYSWSPTASTNDSITGLCPGTYTVTITDLNGCTMTAPTVLTEPPLLTMSASIDNFNGYDISCNGASDGCITVTVLGGVSPYSYLWVPSAGNTTSSACGIAAGTYTVHIVDANGCPIDTSFTLTEPTPVTATTDTIDVLCNGGSTGTAFVIPGGGVAPYTYSWSTSPVQTGQTATGLPQGTYTVTVTDLNGCTSLATAIVTEPTVVTATASTVDALCNGSSTGTAIVVATGGVGGYTYVWNPSGQTTATATGLGQGTYTVTVTDANGCSYTTTTTVNEPTTVTATTTTNSVDCHLNATGSAIVFPTGGVGGYTYVWNTSPAQTGQTATSLTQGTYTVTATDANGCSTVTTAVVNEPSQVSVTAQNDSVICNGGATGSVFATGSGGVSGYTYVWSPIGQTGATVSNLVAGCYSVTVTDINGCTAVTGTCVEEPTAVNVSASSNFVFCNTVSTGSLVANPTGGIPGYTYLWNSTPAQTGQTAIGLPVGTYMVTVTDANGCTTSTSITPTPYSIAVDAGLPDTICGLVDTLNGQVVFATMPLQSIVWTSGTGTISNPSSLTTIVSNLQPAVPPLYTPNVFTITITDANGCTTTDQVAIVAYEDIQADVQSADDTICLVEFTGFPLLAANPAPGTGVWTIGGGNGNPIGIANPSSYSTTYTTGIAGSNILVWTVTNGIGTNRCINDDTAMVFLKVDGYCLDLELPTGYTPNDDGYNDSYIVHGIEAYPENTFIVFNRWGNEVFHKDNYKNNGNAADWYGQNNDGKPLPTGTYYIILAIKNSALRLNTYVDLRR